MWAAKLPPAVFIASFSRSSKGAISPDNLIVSVLIEEFADGDLVTQSENFFFQTSGGVKLWKGYGESDKQKCEKGFFFLLRERVEMFTRCKRNFQA